MTQNPDSPTGPNRRSADRRNAAGRRTRIADAAFRYGTMFFALLVLGIILWIGFGLFVQSAPSRHAFGWEMLTTSEWDVPRRIYGALPFIYGTFVSTGLALLLAVPVGVGAAVFLAEVAPPRIAGPISFFVELLAAVPSVIFGLWGFLVMCPWLQRNVYPFLVEHFGALPLFAGPAYLTNMLAAGLILAMMILPIITSVSRQVLLIVPSAQREGALGLGATRWETIRSVVLPSARSGILGAVILALGRAVGETMAVVMVVGNNPQIVASLLQPGYTMPALLANQFNEAYTDVMQRSALLEIALILFVVTLVVNVIARLMLLSAADRAPGATGPVRALLGKLLRGAGQAAVWALGAAAAIAALAQLVTDVRQHGLRGVFGPLGILLLVLALPRIVTALTRGTPRWRAWRKVNNAAMHTLLAAAAALGCFALAMIFTYVAVQGAQSLSPDFFLNLPKSPDDPTGGMKNAIVGTLMLIGIASAVGIPVGLLGGIFLAEFSHVRIAGACRFAADVLNGIPSVVIGMFAYTVFVLPVTHFSALAGGAALGVMMVPTVMRTTEEMLRLVPGSFREASLSLGATPAQTTFRMMLPAARAGITTGVMLAIARIAGETAPLLFTAFGNDALTTRVSEPVSSITMMIYRYATSAYPAWIGLAWGGALVLLLLVFFISLAARWATRSKYAIR
jgi:phosphate transport system permease protein